MSNLTPEERTVVVDLAADIAKAMLAAAAPEIMKLIAAAQPNMQFLQAGELSVLEPFDPIPVRDYAKEAWIAAYVAALPLSDLQHPFGPDVIAQQALAAFKEAFPS